MANHTFWFRLMRRSTVAGLAAFPLILLAQAPGRGAAAGPNRG